MNRLYATVAERAKHRCEYCKAPEAIFNFPFEVEHVLPSSQQGKNVDSNLALACRSCNLSKSNHVGGRDDETESTAPLFHPRRDSWEDHFQFNAKSGIISGKTASGRVTVERLRMNSRLQCAARVQWMRLGLYP